MLEFSLVERLDYPYSEPGPWALCVAVRDKQEHAIHAWAEEPSDADVCFAMQKAREYINQDRTPEDTSDLSYDTLRRLRALLEDLL